MPSFHRLSHFTLGFCLSMVHTRGQRRVEAAAEHNMAAAEHNSLTRHPRSGDARAASPEDFSLRTWKNTVWTW
jgi:hypothetical protein